MYISLRGDNSAKAYEYWLDLLRLYNVQRTIVQRTISPAELYAQVDLPVVSIYYIRDIVISTIIMYSYHQ